MREEIGERGSGTHSERSLLIFLGFEGILMVGAKEIIKDHPDPSSQTSKKLKNRLKRLPPWKVNFFYLLPYRRSWLTVDPEVSMVHVSVEWLAYPQ